MIRNRTTHFVKPMLEQLEERAQPSFLLSGAVQQLATPLNNMVKDMQSAQTDLNTQFTLIKNGTAPANTFAGAETTAAKAIADWQRILNDSAAITATSNADLAFIRAAAFAVAGEGDPTDAIILFIGPLIGFNPTSALTTPVTQANNIVNDPTLQMIVNTNLHSLNMFVDSTTPISGVTVTPTF
ncbi:MAG TPA: hypothetical protein VH575_00840 [Gemmataceae bacterium]|jgi:hypothetical protein